MGEDPRRPRRVLVVDDWQQIAQALAALLREMGHEVQEAYSGQQAIEAATSFRPHVVVLALRMPGMDGFVTASELRKRPETADAVYVAHTSMSRLDRHTRIEIYRAGFHHHLLKPASLSQFERILATVPASRN